MAKGRKTRPVRAVAEIARERETFKYEPSLTKFRFNSDGRLFPSSELTTASDSILTALALLGAYQTGTKRAFISLFDSNHQYIIAEAAPEIPITSRLPSNKCSVPLSLCGTAIPRSQGTCDHVLYLPSNRETDGEAELPLSFVPNLATDPRFSSRPYCQFGESGQFYAGVPIRTRRGINIGAYCVMSPVVPDDWDDQCTRCLRDISNSIMEHLECNRSEQAYWRSERLNSGLSTFMQGKSRLPGSESREEPRIILRPAISEGSHDPEWQQVDSQNKDCDAINEPSCSGTIVDRPVADPKSKLAGIIGDVDGDRADTACTPDSDDPGCIYSRAANVIREAFDIEGCAFFDVTLGSYKAPPSHIHREKERANSQTFQGQHSSTSSSDEQAPISPDTTVSDPQCDLLGCSTTEASSINSASSNKNLHGVLRRSFLAKLLRRYPNGKIFNFDADGELQSDDSSEDDGVFEAQIILEDTEAIGRRFVEKGRRQLQEGALIHQVFPFARSVAFVPVWDWKGERWFAGGFVYTNNPARVFSVEGDLSILWVFARLIATEVLSVEAAQADKAKSDALGSLSHELRSPLHGVILGTELLTETDLTVFQENTMRTIETCCRTLLDTIDHLLDYTKVNSLTAKRKQKMSTIPPQLRKAMRSDQFGKKSLYSDVELDCLVEEVAESVFAGFNYQQISVRQLSDSYKTSEHNSIAKVCPPSSPAITKQSWPFGAIGKEQAVELGDVRVFLSIDPACRWMFHVPAGAIRRIVMNLFGNSLKYTTKGTIQISLTQDIPKSSGRSMTERLVRLTVRDTGKGMSEDYLRHNLFKPFCQEDDLAPGTGLGLSLVKKITSQLQGHIHVDSQAGVGTSVVVVLPLQMPQQQPDLALQISGDEKTFEEQICELKGLRVRISGFEFEDNRSEHTAMEVICRRWLHLELVFDHQMTPDITLWSDDALPESPAQTIQMAKTPNVVVCRNSLVAHQRSEAYEQAGHAGIFEFISQPIGARKLAKSILLTYKRWMGLLKVPNCSERPIPSRANSTFTRQAMPGVGLLRAEPNAQPGNVELQPMTADATAGCEPRTGAATTFCEASSKRETQISLRSKILIVDDNPINLTVLSTYLSRIGWSYEAVTNGKEAVDTYSKYPNHFVGILMDISMPVMDGLEATRLIRTYEQQNRHQAVAILVLTGLSSDSIHQEALTSGVDVFLTKPVRLKALSEVLESLNLLPSP